MAYGMQLHFTGYPALDLDTWAPLLPLGHYFRSRSSGGSRINDSFSYNHPIQPPSSATSYMNVHSFRAVYGSSTLGNSGAISSGSTTRTTGSASAWSGGKSGFGTYMAYVCSGFADCTNSNVGGFGLSVSNQGVNSILNGTSPPLRVANRYKYTISNKTSTVINIPELDAVREGGSPYVIYVGVSGNSVALSTAFLPKNDVSWSSGAELYVGFLPKSHSQGAPISARSQPFSGTLYVMVGTYASNSNPGGYGLMIKNANSQVTLSPNSVPILAKLNVPLPALNSSSPSTNPFGSAYTIPAAYRGKTLLFPVGSMKSADSYFYRHYYRTYDGKSEYTMHKGLLSKCTDGTYIYDNFHYGGAEPWTQPVGPYKWDYYYEAYYTDEPSSYARGAQRLGIVIAEDYYL